MVADGSFTGQVVTQVWLPFGRGPSRDSGEARSVTAGCGRARAARRPRRAPSVVQDSSAVGHAGCLLATEKRSSPRLCRMSPLPLHCPSPPALGVRRRRGTTRPVSGFARAGGQHHRRSSRGHAGGCWPWWWPCMCCFCWWRDRRCRPRHLCNFPSPLRCRRVSSRSC